MGKQKNLHAIAAYVDNSVKFEDQLLKSIEDYKEEKIIFFTDLLGGSVNNIISNFVKDNENYFLISGMNLPVLLSLLVENFKSDNKEIKKQIEEIISISVQGIKMINFDDNFNLQDEF